MALALTQLMRPTGVGDRIGLADQSLLAQLMAGVAPAGTRVPATAGGGPFAPPPSRAPQRLFEAAREAALRRNPWTDLPGVPPSATSAHLQDPTIAGFVRGLDRRHR